MRRIIPLMLIFFSICATNYAQSEEPLITMTTKTEEGETINLYLSASESTTIQIDFGDGTLENKSIGTTLTTVQGDIAGSEIKIYGNSITYLKCSYKNLTALDVSNAKDLTELDCHNNSLTELNLSNNTALTDLECYSNNLTSLDVSYNTNLTELKCYSNALTTLDLSNNTALTSLACYSNILTSLDISNSTALKYLYCNSNKLSSLDITNNTELKYLWCHSNDLTSLDVSNNTNLKTLKCQSNQLSFSSLPLSPSETYSYAPQADYEINDKVGIGFGVDLSSQYSIDGNTTNYAWKTESGTYLIKDDDYEINNGITTFFKTQSEAVYCEMTNNAFPDFSGDSIFTTTSTTIFSPSITMTTTNEVDDTISIYLESQTDNTTIYIDYGDGTLVEQTIGTSETDVSAPLKGSNIVIYGNSISYLKCSNNNLTTLDISSDTILAYLDCMINDLTLLDVSNNINLEDLKCNFNNLDTLDVSNNTNLTYLKCSSNDLGSLDISHNTKLEYLSINSNNLDYLDISVNTNLATFYCYSNNLDSLDVSNNTNLVILQCYSNNLTILDVSNNTSLRNLNCSDNQLSFSSLPTSSFLIYDYAPQANYQIADSISLGFGIDLSSQYFVDNDTTRYVWKTESGTELIKGEDYEISDGVTTFLKNQSESVYCEMTNNAFPDFSKKDVFKTTSTYIMNRFTVTFVDYDGTTITTQSIGYGNSATAPSDPNRTGYSFSGWDTDFSNVTSNLTVYAKYSVIIYSITYNLNEGTNDTSNPNSYTIESESITFKDATKSGYKFSGWYIDEDFTTQVTGISKGCTGDMEVWAKWEITTAVSSAKNNDIKIYPNPTKGTVHINNSGATVLKVSVFDITGKIVYTKSILQQNAIIDLSDKNMGVYILKIETEDRIMTKRIIKN